MNLAYVQNTALSCCYDHQQHMPEQYSSEAHNTLLPLRVASMTSESLRLNKNEQWSLS